MQNQINLYIKSFLFPYLCDWRKLSVLATWSNYMNFGKRRILLKVFVESKFGYCLLTWMFYGRRANSKINNIHERALRIVYKNNVLSFEELLELHKSFKIPHSNVQSLAIELFKIKNNVSVTIMNDIFQPRAVSYNLRSQIDFNRSNINSEHFEINLDTWLKKFGTWYLMTRKM